MKSLLIVLYLALALIWINTQRHEKYQRAEPIQTVKLDGTIDEIVESIIENDELHTFSLVYSAATLSEYVDT